MNPIKPTDNLVNNAYTHKTAKKAAEKDIAEKSLINKTDKNPESAVNVKKSSNAPADGGVYSKKAGNVNRAALEGININAIRQQNAEQLIQMLYDVLNTQGRQGFIARGKLENAIIGLKNYLENGGTVTPEEQSAAAAAIADDGFWGVEAVSDRLVAMAVKFANGDESKFNMMKSAIEAGFKAAEAAWGGQLPEISYKTFDATMTKLAAAFGQVEPSAETEAS